MLEAKNNQQVELIKVAEQGDIDAQKELADCYSFGKGLEQNDNQAFKWYKAAAEQGDKIAQEKLADCYYFGCGIHKSYTDAFKWYEKSIESGNIRAIYQLSECYFQGKGVNKCPEKTIELLEKYIEIVNKYVEEQYSSEKHLISKEPSLKVNEDASDEIKRKIQEVNNNDYKSELKGLYEKIQKNHEFSISHIRNKLADCYLKGTGVNKKPSIAIEHLKIAADLGANILAQRRLAIYYFGTKDDRSQHYFKKNYNNQSILKESVRAKTELGVFHYHEKNYKSAYECFTESSKSEDALGHLWLAYLIEHYSNNIIHSLDSDINIQIMYEEHRKEMVMESLYMAAASFFFNEDDVSSYYHDSDMINYAFPDEIIEYLESYKLNDTENGWSEKDIFHNPKENNRSISYPDDFFDSEDDRGYPCHIILAYIFRIKKDETRMLDYLAKASRKDMLANYILGKHYKSLHNFNDACHFFKGTLEKQKLKYSPVSKKKGMSTEYPLSFQQFLIYSSKEEVSSIKFQKELEEKNIQLEKAQKKLKELVQSTSHTAGNLLRPNTQAKIAKKLKESEFSDESKKLYYASSDIKYVKQQFKLLETMQSLTGGDIIANQIKLDQVNKSNSQSMNIEGILDLAAFRAIDKLFDTNEYCLDFARETIEKNKINFSKLSDEYQNYVLETDDDSLSIISWCSKNLRPITVIYDCDDWRELFFTNNSQSIALFFCYFFELFFNAFKYADHSQNDFLTITLGSEVISENNFLTITWENPKSNQTSFGSNQGLNLSASYISLLNPDEYKNKSQEVITRSDATFELLTRINKKTFNL